MIGLILAAAGSGSRFGSQTPKQFVDFAGRPLYQHSLILMAAFFTEAVVVVPAAWQRIVKREITQLSLGNRVSVESGGAERQSSVYRGFCRLSADVEIVLVHDAARPYLTAGLVEKVIESTRRHGACVPALPLTETIKEVSPEGQVIRTLPRQRLWLIQTPQGFRRSLLREAFQAARTEDFIGTDEAGLVERLGRPVHVVRGEPHNLKVTWPEDLRG